MKKTRRRGDLDLKLQVIANDLTQDLFTSGATDKMADRLAIMDAQGRDLGGWCAGVVTEKIIRALRRALVEAAQ